MSIEKKYFIVILFILSIITCSCNSFSMETPKKKTTLLQFSFLPCFYEIPKQMDVDGVRIGLPISYAGSSYVNGLDFAFFYSLSNNVNGLQMSFANWGNNGSGVQFGLTNFAKRSNVFQIGLFNESDDKSSCVQFGLINKLENGFCPVFPLINFQL